MTKIRCGDSFGIDINQVVAWHKPKRSGSEGKILVLFLPGSIEGLFIDRDTVGCQAFALLYKLLLDQFAIDLAGEKNLPSCGGEDELKNLL